MERIEILFTPQLEPVGYFNGTASLPEFAAEVSPKSASWDEAVHRSSPILRRMLNALPQKVKEPRQALTPCIDVRTQRLMPGMFPAIPGWHCDDWPRPHYSAQPDPGLVDDRVRHWTAYAASDTSAPPTEFVVEPLLIPIDLEAGALWQQVHRFVEQERPKTAVMRPGEVWEYGPRTIHRARPTMGRCWRQWLRLSWRTQRPSVVESLEHVYLLSEESGW